MKWKILDNAYVPKRKENPLVAAGLGLLGSMFSGFMGSSTNSENIAAQQRENWFNRMWSFFMQKDNQSFQEKFFSSQLAQQDKYWRSQQAYSTDLQKSLYRDNLANQFSFDKQMADYNYGIWQNQQDYAQQIWQQQQDYMSPANQAQRLRDAGFNPALMYGGQQGAAGGLSSAPMSGSSVPAPSGQGSAMPMSPNVGSTALTFPASGIQNQSNPWENMLDGLVKVAAFSEHSAKSEEIWKMIQPKIDNLLADNNFKDSMSAANAVDAYCKTLKLPRELDKLTQEVLTSAAQASMLAKEGVFLDESAASKKAEAALFWAKKNLADKDFINYETVLESFLDKNNAAIGELKSRSLANRAEASYKSALAKTENELREGRVTALDLANRIAENNKLIVGFDAKIKAATWQDELSSLVSQFERSGLMNEELRAKITAAEKANDWYEVNQCLGIFSTVVGGMTNLKGLSIKEMDVKQRKEIADRWNSAYEQDVYLRHNYVHERTISPGHIIDYHYGEPTKPIDY